MAPCWPPFPVLPSNNIEHGHVLHILALLPPRSSGEDGQAEDNRAVQGDPHVPDTPVPADRLLPELPRHQRYHEAGPLG